MIAEILLYSFGYTTGKEMATKIVMTYKLCSEQLIRSLLDHGMRAVIAVLLARNAMRGTCLRTFLCFDPSLCELMQVFGARRTLVQWHHVRPLPRC